MHGRIPRGSICAPGGEAQTFGDQLFTNYGHAAVVLDSVTLLDPRNQRLIGAYAVPGVSLIGTLPWPPEPSPGFPLPSTWKLRQPLRGFRLAAGKSFNIVLGVRAIRAGQATSLGMAVYYRDATDNYVAYNYYANVIAATKAGCD